MEPPADVDPRVNRPAVILAGGRSRRMGFPKALLTVDGSPAITRIAERLRAVGADPLLVVTSEDDVTAAIAGLVTDVRIVTNPHPENGMISSIRLALDNLPASADGALFHPVDHPLVTETTYGAILADGSPDQLVIPVDDGRRGHPVWWGRNLWHWLRSPVADNGARNVIPLIPQAIVEVPVDDPGILWNLNTPEDVARVEGAKHLMETRYYG